MEWIAVILSLIGMILNAKKNIWCWPIWILSDCVWLYCVAIKTYQPQQIILWIAFLISNIYGWYWWRKLKSK